MQRLTFARYQRPPVHAARAIVDFATAPRSCVTARFIDLAAPAAIVFFRGFHLAPEFGP